MSCAEYVTGHLENAKGKEVEIERKLKMRVSK
jgi:hypothetical protein